MNASEFCHHAHLNFPFAVFSRSLHLFDGVPCAGPALGGSIIKAVGFKWYVFLSFSTTINDIMNFPSKKWGNKHCHLVCSVTQNWRTEMWRNRCTRSHDKCSWPSQFSCLIILNVAYSDQKAQSKWYSYCVLNSCFFSICIACCFCFTLIILITFMLFRLKYSLNMLYTLCLEKVHFLIFR